MTQSSARPASVGPRSRRGVAKIGLAKFPKDLVG
jgi:hypothetical protein